MKKRVRIVLVIFVAFINQAHVFSQHWVESDKSLKPGGDIPHEFMVSVAQKYEMQKDQISFYEPRQIRLAQLQFYIESNFWISDLLLSGKLLYGEILSQYVNDVAAKLLKHDKELLEQLQFYVIKSPAVNAFATDQGIIFVTVGLLAKLHNEAELGFILAHETGHFVKKHNMGGYIEKIKIKRGMGEYRKHSIHDLIIKQHSYSRELETEADLIGLETYDRSPYSLSAISGVFDVLEEAHLPTENILFKKSFLETKGFEIPGAYILDTNYVATLMDESDSLSTHPAVDKRRTMITQAMGDDQGTKNLFLLPESTFQQCKLLSRYELCRLYLLQREYEMALYNAYMLLEDHPKDPYLLKTVAKALYGIQIHRNYKIERLSAKPSEWTSGNILQVYGLLDSLGNKSIAVMGMHYVWNLSNELPDDQEINLLNRYFIRELIHEHWDEKSDTSWQNFVQRNLKLLQKDPAFMSLQSTIFSEEKNKEIVYNIERRQLLTGNIVYKMNPEVSDGVRKLVVMDPYLLKFDLGQQYILDLLGAEKTKKVTASLYEKNAKKLRMDVKVLNSKGLKKSDTEELYELAILNYWADEVSQMQEESEDINVFPTDYQQLMEIKKKYNTKYFLWNTTLTLRSPRRINIVDYLYLAFFPPLIPAAFLLGLNPIRRLQYRTILYNIDTHKIVYRENRTRNRSASKSVMSSLTRRTLRILSR